MRLAVHDAKNQEPEYLFIPLSFASPSKSGEATKLLRKKENEGSVRKPRGTCVFRWSLGCTSRDQT
jgi:hypothetical protein